MRQAWNITLTFLVLRAPGCSGGSLATRENSAGTGAFGDTGVGGIVGAAVGHPGARAAVGGQKTQEGARIVALRICLFLQAEIERLNRKNVWMRWQHSEG